MNSMGTILLAGIYGVGKSTIAEKLSVATGIPNFSAGDLISAQNGEQYGANKLVIDKEKNQDILALCVADLLRTSKRILLAGHFCIVNENGQVDLLPSGIFDKLQIERIILLEANPLIIQSHLAGRDNKNYSTDLIRSMYVVEHDAAQDIAYRLSVPLLVHQMSYSEVDVQELMAFIG